MQSLSNLGILDPHIHFPEDSRSDCGHQGPLVLIRGKELGMISQAVEYSLRAMVLLTQNVNSPLTTQAIAERGQIPAPYLSKLLQGLTRAGLVTAQRGVGGGYLLSRSPDTVTLAEIMNAIEPLQRIRACPLGIAGHVTLCPLHRRLDEALAMVERTFQETTLNDLCQEGGGSVPLCNVTPPLLALDLGDAPPAG